MLPLTYILAKQLDILGPAVANLVSVTIYNIVRVTFLWKKFRLFPFTIKSVYTVLVAAACYAICHFAFYQIHGFWGLVIRSVVFLILYGAATIYFRLSPDIVPVITSIRKRFGIFKIKM